MNNPRQPYSAQEIQRYLNGQMSNEEMHRLEKDAMDDPFLQDAIDGYAGAAEAGDAEHIPAIIAELESFTPNKKTNRYKNVAIPIWQRKIIKYAAAAIITGSAGWFLFNQSQPASDAVAFKTSNIVQPADTQTQANVQTRVDTGAGDVSVAAISKNDSEPLPGLAQAKIERPTSELKPSTLVGESSAAPVSPQDESLSATTTDLVTSPAAGYSQQPKSLRKSNNETVISGKVLDVDNYPLDNIAINIKGSKRATYTDELGRFNVTVPDSGTVVIASGRGFKTREILSKQLKDKLILKMERSAADEEVVVANENGYRETNDILDTVEAVPVGGWEHFEKYLEGIKPAKKKARKTQDVVLTFEIDRYGNPTEFEIIESGGDYFNAEAIRAIKEGPRWKNKTKNPYPVVKLTLSF